MVFLDKGSNFFIFFSIRLCVCIHRIRNSRVAQLVEQVAVNHLVAGSSPASGVRFD